ncbi:MAG: hypothetical protein ABI267_08755 [Ginsengibacter sp.]
MKIQAKSFVFLLLILTMYSCFPCGYLKCGGNNFDGQFRIVDKVTGDDLVFGPTSIYDKNKIRFFSLNGRDTISYEYTTIKFGGLGYDSILYVTFYPPPATPVFMKLNDADTDTLLLSYKTSSSKCCGTHTEITKYRYNDSTEFPGNEGTQVIRK